MTRIPLEQLVHPTWLPALDPLREVIAAIGDRLREEVASGHGYLPAGGRVLRAFAEPMDAVRVLLVGQDPYPTPGHAVGLSFSVEPDVRPLPKSLSNIFSELVDDLAVPRPTCGDLSPWAQRGVLLLNRVLTVRSGEPGSHRGWGWEQVTDAAVRALAERHAPLVAILWGRQAQAVTPLLAGVPIITSAHPSPLSAHSGFFGSKPFSRANAALMSMDSPPVDWQLP